MSEQTLYDKIVEGWERSETNSGVPYYVNHQSERTSWDHPYLAKVLEELSVFDEIKYAAYRTSFKIRQLQRHLHLHHVELVTVRRVFEELGHTEGSWETIPCTDLTQILVSLFRASPSSYRSTDEPENLADLVLNLILNMFDSKRTGCIRVMSAKILLATLSSARLAEKYRFFYQELHDPSTFISQRILASFLEDLVQLPEVIRESSAFGRNVDPAVASCCQMGQGSGGVSEDVFYRWLQKEPQTLVWLPTFHRVAATETVKHEARCNVCKAYPITGFRYRCLKCFNFDLCQQCFFTGKTRKRHKQKHPIQEYCLTSTTKDDTAAFMKTLKNNLSRKASGKLKKKYLPIEADSQTANQEWLPPVHIPEPDIHSEISETARRLADMESLQSAATSPVHSPTHTLSPAAGKENVSPVSDGLHSQRQELESIIQQLEAENRALYQELCRMKEPSDTESNVSEERPALTASGREVLGDRTNKLASHLHKVQNILQDTEKLPKRDSSAKAPSPLYLSVPIVKAGEASHRSPGSSSHSHGSPHLSPWRPIRPPGDNKMFYLSSPGSSPSPLSEHSPSGNRTLDSLDDLDVSPSHFSLPSPSQTRDFGEEEAELEALVGRVDQMFPSDLSYTEFSMGRPLTEEDVMLQAANSVGTAMSEFVRKAVPGQSNC